MPAADEPGPAEGPGSPLRLAFAGCVAAAAASLIVLRVPSYDPTTWLIWGREVFHGTLDTSSSPSWKPLPVAFTTLFAAAGDGTAPVLWLFVARAGGFMGLVLAYRLARRLGGVAAGWFAVAGLALATDFLYNTVRGDSEGLLVALVLGAIVLHFEDRRPAAFGVAVLAAGLRPETWLLVGAYGVWLAVERRQLAVSVAVAATGVLVLAAWFVPDYLSTGDFLRGATRATDPEPGSPGQAAFPIGAAVGETLRILAWPFYAGAAVAVARALRAGRRTAEDTAVLVVGLGALVLAAEVAGLAQRGFTGNVRYHTLAGALLAVVGGVGLPGLVAYVRRRLPVLVGLVLVAPAAAAVEAKLAGIVDRGERLSREERAMGGGLKRAIDLAGGPAAVRACGRISSTPYQRARVAYDLRVPQSQVAARALAPGTMFVRAGQIGVDHSRLAVRGTTRDWTVRSSCPPPAG